MPGIGGNLFEKIHREGCALTILAHTNHETMHICIHRQEERVVGLPKEDPNKSDTCGRHRSLFKCEM